MDVYTMSSFCPVLFLLHHLVCSFTTSNRHGSGERSQVSAAWGLFCSAFDLTIYTLLTTCHIGNAALQTACWWRASHTMQWGIDLYTCLEFWTFFSLKVRGQLIYGLPYTRV